MKSEKLILFLAILFMFSLQSCVKDTCQREVTYVKSTPIYASLEEIRAPLEMEGARDLEDPGKIYYYNNYIFINEKRTGVHIFDNSIPSSPQSIGFLNIPGNVDIAIRNGVMLADNYIDLLSIDISDPKNPFLVKRTTDVFPSFGESEEGILVYVEREEVTEMVDCDSANDQIDDGWVLFETADGNLANGAPSAGGDGIGGSLARFSLYDEYLYAIDNSNMYTFSISDLTNPTKVGEMNVGWNIETLYAFGDKLFIGSQNGMFIYDAADPAAPQYLSGYAHWTSCDPVFVKDNYAYVTLHGGTLCNGSLLNQLDLIDITDILNPTLVETFPMEHPHGLSIKDNNLFLCEADAGLKVFDIQNPLVLDENLLTTLSDFSAKDVIVLPGDRNILLVTGDDGFYQVNFDDPEDLDVLSVIKVER